MNEQADNQWLWFEILKLIRDDRQDYLSLAQDVELLYEAAMRITDAKS